MISAGGESFFSVEIVDRENPIFQELNLRDPDLSLPKIYKYNYSSIITYNSTGIIVTNWYSS